MTYLEAMKILKGFSSINKQAYTLVMSGTPDQLIIFLRATAARAGIQAQIKTIAFGSLHQHLFAHKEDIEPEVVLFTTYDLIPEGDWRSGMPRKEVDTLDFLTKAEEWCTRIKTRNHAKSLYLPCPLLPLFEDDLKRQQIQLDLKKLALDAGAALLPDDIFSMASYLASGSPVSGTHLGFLAESIHATFTKSRKGVGKVLVTDLDNVLWHGVVGEDGAEGVLSGAEGPGYAHYVYQNYLKSLSKKGVVLAAVSRNDADLALAPFKAGNMQLAEDDFVAIVASYNAKSAQIKSLSQQLNLGLDSFAFVDDNPIELAEVATTLPDVHCLPFPAQLDQLPNLLYKLSDFFSRDTVTAEDKNRTQLYKARLKSLPPSETKGSDLIDFLKSLEMSMQIYKRSKNDCDRAIQLLNKTNQFNLNGDRYSKEQVIEILEAGGALYTADLTDKNGSHGEVIAFLSSANGDILSWVMSCRVFQRKMEHVFLGTYLRHNNPPKSFLYKLTDRNEPIQKFLDDSSFSQDGMSLKIDTAKFISSHAPALELFKIKHSFS